MDLLSLSSSKQRRARTRSLIQLGGLIEKSGLLDVFGITLGEDLQKSPNMKEPIASLFKGLLELKEIANSDDVDLQLWANQGLESFKSMGIPNERPLDKISRKLYEIIQDSDNRNETKSFFKSYKNKGG
jgi:hypothetical protein